MKVFLFLSISDSWILAKVEILYLFDTSVLIPKHELILEVGFIQVWKKEFWEFEKIKFSRWTVRSELNERSRLSVHKFWT